MLKFMCYGVNVLSGGNTIKIGIIKACFAVIHVYPTDYKSISEQHLQRSID